MLISFQKQVVLCFLQTPPLFLSNPLYLRDFLRFYTSLDTSLDTSLNTSLDTSLLTPLEINCC